MTGLVAVLLLVSSTHAAPVSGSPALRLGSNENPYGFSPKAKEAMIATLDSANYYNRDVVNELTQLLASKEGVKPDAIYLTAGSGPILELLGMAYGVAGKNVVNVSPGYPQASQAFKRAGGEIKYAPLGKNLGYDFDALAAAIDGDTRMVYICNPNNPTGVLADPVAMRKFILNVPREIVVVVDEAYLELADTSLATNTMAPMTKVRENLIVTRTFSKAYAMAGLRVGYAISSPQVLARMKKIDPGISPSYLAAIAAKEAVKDQAFMEENRRKYAEVRRDALKQFDHLGLKYAEPQGAFVLFDTGRDSTKVREKFLENEILVTRPQSFDLTAKDMIEYQNWLRVSLGTPEDMKKFFDVLKVILEKS